MSAQLTDRLLQGLPGTMVRYHQVSRGQPLLPGGLGREPSIDFVPIQPSLQKALYPNPVVGVDHDPWPVPARGQ